MVFIINLLPKKKYLTDSHFIVTRAVYTYTLFKFKFKWITKIHLKVANELALDNIDVAELRNKWANLRVTFRTNVTKMRKKKARDDYDTVPWRHFKSMLFLKINDVQQPIASTSTIFSVNSFLFQISLRLVR